MLLELLPKIILVIVCFTIFYQDIKDREVSLWLLLLANLAFFYSHYIESTPPVFWQTVGLNLLIIGFLLLVLWSYSKFKLKLALSETFGFGDLLFFIAIALGLPTVSFLVLFVASLCFALVIFIVFKKRFSHPSVPLAGLQALFLALIFLLNWTFEFVNLYRY